MRIMILSFAMAALLGAPSQHTTTAVPVSSNQSEATKTVATGFRPGRTFRDCPDCPEMAVIPAGSFMMGSPASEPGRYDGEEPQRRVSIRQLAVGKFDVTRGQWAAFVSATNRDSPLRETNILNQGLHPALEALPLKFDPRARKGLIRLVLKAGIR